MNTPVSIAQSHRLVSILTSHVDWETLDGDLIQQIIDNPQAAGAEFTAFLKNRARLCRETNPLRIDRSEPFNPAEFLGNGWSVEEEDERSLSLTEIDLSQVRLEPMLKADETWIKGEEKLRRLKEAGHLRLDARIFETLWQNLEMIPKSWKEKTGDQTSFIFFDGTILRDPSGDRYVLCLCWDDGRWSWDSYWLEFGWDASYPSAVLVA